MKIKQCKRTVLFQDIERGDVFKMNDLLYVKIQLVNGCNALDLQDSTLTCIDYEAEIDVMECELVVR